MIYVTRKYMQRLAIEASKIEKEEPLLSHSMKEELKEIHEMVNNGTAFLVNTNTWRMCGKAKRKRIILEVIATGEKQSFQSIKAVSNYLGKTVRFVEFAMYNNMKIDGYSISKN